MTCNTCFLVFFFCFFWLFRLGKLVSSVQVLIQIHGSTKKNKRGSEDCKVRQIFSLQLCVTGSCMHTKNVLRPFGSVSNELDLLSSHQQIKEVTNWLSLTLTGWSWQCSSTYDQLHMEEGSSKHVRIAKY